jgi:hypothetical protein
VGQHRSASGSILLDLDGFEVTAAKIIDDEWRLAVQTASTANAPWWSGSCASQRPSPSRGRRRDLASLGLAGGPVDPVEGDLPPVHVQPPTMLTGTSFELRPCGSSTIIRA